ncbi:MAG: hypothetical protein IPH59_13910 [bacterium]|nr:hypothetical protein [bacterium]
MKTTITILSLLLLAVLSGCSKDTSTGVADKDSNQVPGAVQDLLTKHAVPLAIPTSETDLAQPGVAPAEPPYANYDVYAVTLLWGSLTNTTPTPGPTLDWSGTAGINGVATIDVTHTIDFEPGQDSIILYDVPSTVAWASSTNNDFDGINMLIYVDRDIAYITAPVFTLATAQITKTYYIEELANLNAFYLVSNTASLAIHARRIYSTSCPTGILSGEWIKSDNSGQTGTFHTDWWEQNSEPYGQLAGNFWTEPDGERIFEGWVSEGLTARVVYHVYGTWYYDDPTMCPLCGSRRGQFIGFYSDMNNKLLGMVKGQMGNMSLDAAELHLPLSGYWRKFCGNTDYMTVTWMK